MAWQGVKIIKDIYDESDRLCIITNQYIGNYIEEALRQRNERELQVLEQQFGSSILLENTLSVEYENRKIKKEIYDSVVKICKITNQKYSGYISATLKASNEALMKKIMATAV